jgi:hypothetical protein
VVFPSNTLEKLYVFPRSPVLYLCMHARLSGNITGKDDLGREIAAQDVHLGTKFELSPFESEFGSHVSYSIVKDLNAHP